jgi:hypothetical protein
MTSLWSSRLGAITVAFAALTIPSIAGAQADDAQRSAARQFATDGLTAFNAGQYDKAIDLFTRAESLVHAPPHLLYIARASAKTGKLVHAKEMYVKITRETLASSAPKAFTEAQSSANTELAQLDPRIPKLTITLAGPGAPGAKVTLDGVEVPSALIGAPQPADPGSHVLKATSDGYKPADGSVTLAEKGGDSVTLTIDQRAPVEVLTASTTENPSTIRKVAPWIGFGVGAAGIAVGTIFMFQNRSKRDDADALCVNGRCPTAKKSDIQSLDDKANKAETFSIIGYGVGVAGVAVGALFLIMNTGGSKTTTTGAITPWIGANGGGVGGRF